MTTAPTATEPPPGRSVFIVDDDPCLVEALSELLREEGYFVEAHTDAHEAISRLQSGARPDVVLLDYLMPAMNGEEFLDELSRSGIQLKVLLFTAMNEPHVRAQAQRVAGVIRKPFDVDRLIAELERLRPKEETGR